MVLVGRTTKDAAVNQLKDDKQVINFTLAINDYYKPRNGEGKNSANYINCSYWMNAKLAERITKGTLVEATGRIYVNTYMGINGEPKASLNCHVNSIKLHSTAKTNKTTECALNAATITEPLEDLPF
ncbi:single-stranded DNA-binding protein [Segetibacter koreensis]|uniref:single-stranded DNA-binding protein n=1 Tax=Segetibacter koreensis TaxID=398037 RepID=UPI000361B0A8|nr:single-stranded DNA-binding protein [Segetibacter koreensis]